MYNAQPGDNSEIKEGIVLSERQTYWTWSQQ